MDYPLRSLCSLWCDKIRLAANYKAKVFGDDAAEAMQFFNGPHDWLYTTKYGTRGQGFVVSDEDGMPHPAFRMTVNRVAEMVQIFGPVLYHRNPIRKVNARKTPLPPIELYGDPGNLVIQSLYQQAMGQFNQYQGQDNARALLLETYLNYTPNELDLKSESRRAIDEAIIKGLGLIWTETYRPAGANFNMVGSFYGSVDELFIDPDMESMPDANWITRKCVHPVWDVEVEYGIPPGTLKGNLESYAGQAKADQGIAGKRATGDLSNDLLCYYKVYSKQGIGARLSGADKNLAPLDQFGDYCYLVVAPDVPYPLNLHPSVMETATSPEDIFKRLEWPTPFWADDEWPFTPIQFHEVPRSAWPMSHLKPAMGEMKFLNWAYSFLAGKIRTTCRDFLAVKKSASEEIKQAIQSGQDLTLLEIDSQHQTIKEIVEFLQHPQMNGDIWLVISAIEHNLEKRLGLTELVYGLSERQMRSASEADVKASQISVRPDDMAQKVEDAMTIVARKEALACRWHLGPQDVMGVLGPMAPMWGTLVQSQDLSTIMSEMEYRIEAGSARKPNKEREASNMTQAMQTIFPTFIQYGAATADYGPANKLIKDWAKSIDLDPEGYQMLPPMPPAMPQAPPGQPGENPEEGSAPPGQSGPMPMGGPPSGGAY